MRTYIIRRGKGRIPMLLLGASPCGQRLPGGASPQRCQSLHHGAPTSIFPMALRHGAPTNNKPHPAEKSTPVWLAIWHIWAGFANSQLQCATFHSTYSYKFTSSLLPTCNRCSDIANLSAHLHQLPTPPPYLRRMRLLHGLGASIRWMIRLPPGLGAGIRWMMRLLPGCVRGC